ncbi:MAG: FG-GAP repeat domain-containing protein, partial [Planctomycetota bacterium]
MGDLLFALSKRFTDSFFFVLLVLSMSVVGTGSVPELPGWPIFLPNTNSIEYNVIVVDIDDDGRDEVVFGVDNYVHIFDSSGHDIIGWPQKTSDSVRDEIRIVAVGDIDGDGDKEVICKADDDPNLYAWHCETGDAVTGWPITRSASDIVLGNFDSDNDLEIVVVTAGSNVFEVTVLNGNGSIVGGWPKSFSVSSISQVYLSTGNIDGQGQDEIVVACHKSGYYGSPIYIFRADGSVVSGWPQQCNGPFVSPAVLCNLDGGDDYEVVAATINGSHTGKVYAWKSNGTLVDGWPSSHNAFDLSAGDLDRDGRPEIIASYSNTDYHADHLAVLGPNGAELFSTTLELRVGGSVCNVDFDLDPEIIIPPWHGNLEVQHMNGQDADGFPIYIDNGIQSCPSATGDIDGDGDVEIIQYDKDNDKLHAFDMDGPASEHPDWPMLRHDERRSSCLK